MSKEDRKSKPMPKEWLEDIKKAVEVMQRGGIIVYPTDTIWGIGCDATNEESVKRIYDIKKRAEGKALVVLVDSEVKIESHIKEVPDVAWQLIEVAVRPLTLVLDGARGLASNLPASDGSVAIRLTNEAFSKELCRRMKRPLVSTSANISGEKAPGNFADISEEIKAAVDYVCTSRREEKGDGCASSIIKLCSDGQISIIRE